MTVQSYDPDPTDWRLLAELQADGRLSFNELARRVHLSPPGSAGPCWGSSSSAARWAAAC